MLTSRIQNLLLRQVPFIPQARPQIPEEYPTGQRGYSRHKQVVRSQGRGESIAKCKAAQ